MGDTLVYVGTHAKATEDWQSATAWQPYVKSVMSKRSFTTRRGNHYTPHTFSQDNTLQRKLTDYYRLYLEHISYNSSEKCFNVKYKQLYLNNDLTLSRNTTPGSYNIFVRNMDVSEITKNLQSANTPEENREIEETVSLIGEEIECQVDVPEGTHTSSEEEEEEEEPPKKKRKSTYQTWTLLTLLMSMPAIRLDQYGAMYQKYKRAQKSGKLPRQMMEDLYRILTTVGEMAKILDGQTFIQNYSKHVLVEQWCTTCIDVKMKRKLMNWLNEFTEAAEDNRSRPNSGKKDSPLLASMLPSPVQTPSTTFTLSTTADGRTAPAVAGRSADSGLLHSSGGESDISPLYRPRTSGFYRSMCFKKGNYKYSLKSPGIEGDFIVKLEIYNSRTVLGQQTMDWWKHAEMRAFVPVKDNSPSMRAALQLHQELQKLLEKQPDAEGDYVQLK